MALLVPRHMVAPQPPPRTSARIGTYLTLSMLTAKRYLPADVLNILTRYRRSAVIRWVTAISGWVSAERGKDIGEQLQMAQAVLTDELLALATDRVFRDLNISCIFYSRQLMFVLQSALLVCKEDSPECDDQLLRKALGEALLMASDVVNRIESDTKHEVGGTPQDVNRWVAMMHASFFSASDNWEILARAQSFWFDIAEGKTIRDHIEKMKVEPLAVAFEEAYGLALREFFTVLQCVYLRFRHHVNANSSPLCLEIYDFLKPYFAAEIIEKAISIVSADPETLAFKLISQPRQNWATDFQALRERPVIQISPGQAVCPDFGLLYRCLTDGIYHLLNKAYGNSAFPKLFGYIFEEYVSGLIRQFAYDGPILVRAFYQSPYFEGTKDQAGDGILHWEDTAVVMEYKARQLTSRERYAGIEEALVAGIDDILGKEGKGRDRKGVYQLSANLQRLLAGERIVAGSGQPFDVSKSAVVYPMLVVYEESVVVESIRQMAEEKLRASLRKLGVADDRVGPLFLFSATDLEAFEALARKIPPQRLFREYAHCLTEHPKARLGNFRTFLVNSGYGDLAKVHESWVGQKRNRALQESVAELNRREAVRRAS